MIVGTGQRLKYTKVTVRPNGIRASVMNASIAGLSIYFLGASALSTSQITLVFAAARVVASPDLTVFSSRWTFHFQD
ncbi:MAG: hypothetical protein WA303_12650 [Bradyrhizobium sp.]|jgi:hypothetical protein